MKEIFNFYIDNKLKCSINLEIVEAAAILIEIKKRTGSAWTIKRANYE